LGKGRKKLRGGKGKKRLVQPGGDLKKRRRANPVKSVARKQEIKSQLKGKVQ